MNLSGAKCRVPLRKIVFATGDGVKTAINAGDRGVKKKLLPRGAPISLLTEEMSFKRVKRVKLVKREKRTFFLL
jgi:hypothetical protein